MLFWDTLALEPTLPSALGHQGAKRKDVILGAMISAKETTLIKLIIYMFYILYCYIYSVLI